MLVLIFLRRHITVSVEDQIYRFTTFVYLRDLVREIKWILGVIDQAEVEDFDAVELEIGFHLVVKVVLERGVLK